jgi:hypothetical protein
MKTGEGTVATGSGRFAERTMHVVAMDELWPLRARLANGKNCAGAIEKLRGPA